ncbi:tyrosine--tRNA ligase [Spiroplasma culicicola]|uniref:Tyrosine--tRNA ligase n=1 Tax=Spiroplasma culicicola AES-1 TaxID=1276246 RepID=W6AHR7_9MOLU|nr:tyrosine--tRNA ligase [Spiroplasma culicicola]AHI53229.1 tyrosyl-tRNA synthetase [Spiroplasma culicicola AES-1]
MKHILDELKDRSLLKQFTNENKINLAQESGAGVYCGFDPTADSLHIGHLIQIINLKRFGEFGFAPIAIIGGGTGMIGDPSFKAQERKLLSLDEVDQNVKAIAHQIKKLVPDVEIVNNGEWLNTMSLVDFLRDIGKDFNLAYLLAKENIASRIEKGLSITEFSYTMLQGYDFFKLYTNSNCHVQIGGSDQWGNITSGIDYIASKLGREESKACGITMNLLTKKDGVKFGKTESGAIWLDASKTSEYEFYQFFVNQEDEELEKLFNFLTTLSIEEIKIILEEHQKEPFKRVGQKKLAQVITTWVHGESGYQKALQVTEAFFNGNLNQLEQSDLKAIANALPQSQAHLLTNIVEFLVQSAIASSNREARELIRDKAITIMNKNDFTEEDLIDKSFISFDQTIIVKKGKRKYFSVKCS